MSVLEYSESFRAWGKSSWRNVHRCKLCPYFTTSLFFMVNHVRRHRSPLAKLTCGKAKIELFYCKDCDFKTELTILFKQHINKNHGVKVESRDDLSSQDFVIQNYVCKKCSFETNLSLKWLQHTSECTGKKENLQSVSYLQDGICWHCCTDCNFKAKVQSHVRDHIKRCHWSKAYACEKCPFKSRYKTSLRKHVNGVHLDEQDGVWYRCIECPFKTRYKVNLKNHAIAKHTAQEEIKWYECDLCPLKTRKKYTLREHINRVHSNEEDVKWYECDKCPFKTKYKHSFKIHINVKHVDGEQIQWNTQMLIIQNNRNGMSVRRVRIKLK
ncbi:zinc finger protein 142-like isoform X2 [Zophobas morio]|uniref:zinc finger protein 142-like isoform X2 n=1 Tax=Zophobas morio TaxID=2755281 RepID=UPI003082F242